MNLPPGWKLDLITPPASEPVTVAEAKAHAKVEFADDDALIGSLITAARLQVEHRTRRALMPQGWRLSFDALPGGNAFQAQFTPFPALFTCNALTLPKPPLISLDALSYLPLSGPETALDVSKLVVSLGTPGRISPAPYGFWPYSLPQIGGCRVDFTAGYADADHVPANIKLACMWLVNFWYQNRSGAGALDIPEFVDRLLAPSIYMSYP